LTAVVPEIPFVAAAALERLKTSAALLTMAPLPEASGFHVPFDGFCRLFLDPSPDELQFCRGMSFEYEPIEWDDEITMLIDRLEEKSAEGGLTRQERALMDVVETVQLLDPEGDGLHEFWHTPLDHRRIINSFDMIGAGAMVDVLNASQWCRTRDEDRDQYTETEAEYLAGIEEELYEALGELPDQVAEFVEDELEG
jgi:hypothetical protein